MPEDKDLLKEICETAEILKESDSRDIDELKIGILFPLMEYLKYDVTKVGDIQMAPLYAKDNSYKIDFGLRAIDPDSFKTVIKVIDVDDDPEAHFSKIRSCVIQSNSIEYVIITDCYKYYIYSYDAIENKLLEISRFDICDENSVDTDVLKILENPSITKDKQQYALYDDEEEEYEGPRQVSNYVAPEPEPEEKSENKKIKWGLIILAQVLLIAIVIAVVMIIKNPNNDIINFFVGDKQSTLDYYDIQSSINASIDKANNALEIEFSSSDIPSGGVIRFDIVNGDDSATVYGNVSDNGMVVGSYAIPEYWKNPSIVVTSYLKFDELDHAQSRAVKDKFGEIGEKIIKKDGAPSKFALSYTTIEYDSESVREYLLWLKEQEEANLRAERLKDFEGANIRYDALGNIKVLPAGYDMNNVNITGNVHVYPQIFYDAQNNFAHFYLVCGQVSSVTWSMFREVAFYADGTGWSYKIDNNEKKQQVTGQYITEWVYFDNYNIASLPSETALLGLADEARIQIIGSKIGEYYLSADEKANINYMLALYNKYFSDSSNPPSTSWFEEQTDTGSSNNNNDEKNYTFTYIQTPSGVLDRDSNEQKNLNNLKKLIDEANKGAGATETQLTTYDIDSKKFKVFDESVRDAIMEEFKTATGILVYEQDFESSKADYYKIFFEYENPKSIEAGYIPYMYIMDNKTVYLPVKTDTGATTSEKSYASFIMSQKTFDIIANASLLNEYQQIEPEKISENADIN